MRVTLQFSILKCGLCFPSLLFVMLHIQSVSRSSRSWPVMSTVPRRHFFFDGNASFDDAFFFCGVNALCLYADMFFFDFAELPVRPPVAPVLLLAFGEDRFATFLRRPLPLPAAAFPRAAGVFFSSQSSFGAFFFVDFADGVFLFLEGRGDFFLGGAGWLNRGSSFTATSVGFGFCTGNLGSSVLRIVASSCLNSLWCSKNALPPCDARRAILYEAARASRSDF